MTEKYYFICSLDGLDLNSKEVPRMRFLKRGRSWRNPSSFSEDISEGMPLVYSRLSLLVEDFVLGGQRMTDTASMAMLAKRLKTLVTRLIVARYTELSRSAMVHVAFQLVAVLGVRKFTGELDEHAHQGGFGC